MKHNFWLSWKISHGLASHGRRAALKPKGFLAKMLYNIHFKEHDVHPVGEEMGIKVFKQEVGGSLGPAGDL